MAKNRKESSTDNAQKWYEKPLFTTLANVLPATLVAIVAIFVQIYLANDQMTQSNAAERKDEVKDSINEIKENLKEIDRINLAKIQVELNTQKQRDDIIQGNTLSEINKNQLDISRAQLKIINDKNKIEILNNLSLFGVKLHEYGEVVNSKSFFMDYSQSNSDNEIKSLNYVLSYLKNQSLNPILLENPKLLKDFYMEIYKTKAAIHMAYIKKDSIGTYKIYDDYVFAKSMDHQEVRAFYLKQKEFFNDKQYKYLKISTGQKVIDYNLETQW